MAFTWTDDMGNIGPRGLPNLEAAARAAVCAGATVLDAIPKDAPQASLPTFNGSQFLVPKNDAAAQFAAEVYKHIPQGIGGIARETILATAVQVAFRVRGAGGGDAGWSALKDQLAKQRRRG